MTHIGGGGRWIHKRKREAFLHVRKGEKRRERTRGKTLPMGQCMKGGGYTRRDGIFEVLWS